MRKPINIPTFIDNADPTFPRTEKILDVIKTVLRPFY